MVDFGNFNTVAAWLSVHGYWIVFLIMCVEGPITTAAAGFLAASGIFNPGIILALSIMGDLVPDSLYYYIGYGSRSSFIKKIGHWLGFNDQRIEKTEAQLKAHFGKTMLALKLTPVVSTLGFVAVGYLRMSFRKFIGWCSAVTVPKSILFLLIGYFFGQLYNINQYLHYASVLFPVAVVLLAGAIFAYGKLSAMLLEKINNSNKR